MKKYLLLIACLFTAYFCNAQTKPLLQLQEDFVNQKFGMFIHFNIPTYLNDDWADPDASPKIFNPKKLDCTQWAKAAKQANMTYGCLTTKHHSGFCIWDTKTTDYSVMSSPSTRDVVKEYADAFRKEGLDVMLYYSILDTHHKLRPGFITSEHVVMIKEQLTELLTNYGPIRAIIIDGWDAPWSRISYNDIPFEDIYHFIKSLQPNCLVMDLNAAKYPTQALFYTDIKSYEQGAGQHIEKDVNILPALSCLPLNSSWFWKKDFPHSPVKDIKELIFENLIPQNAAYCNFILNVAPNRDGLIDENAVKALKEIGKLWNDNGQRIELPIAEAPITASNLAKGKPTNASWGTGMHIMDLINDDDFKTGWYSNPTVKDPWVEIELDRAETPFNMVVITQMDNKNKIDEYIIEYLHNNKWETAFSGKNSDIIKINRFDQVRGNKVRVRLKSFSHMPSIAELGVYNERR